MDLQYHCPHTTERMPTAKVNERNSIQTFDQQLYAIAKQVGWAMSETFKTHIVRLESYIHIFYFFLSAPKGWS
jgi:hypothetical protein